MKTDLIGKLSERQRVSNKVRQRKTHGAYYVMCIRPTLNNRLELTSLTLFQNGVT